MMCINLISTIPPKLDHITDQMKRNTVSYLGPLGTYSYQVANSEFPDAELIPQPTIDAVVSAVSSNQADIGIVPFENSTYGSVKQTLDAFIHDSGTFEIDQEIELQVHHCLLSNEKLGDVKRIYSHPQALGQCAEYISRNCKDATLIETDSTAKGAEIACKEKGSAAIGSYILESLFPIKVIAENIETFDGNTTKFMVLQHGHTRSERTGYDVTLVLICVRPDYKGGLGVMLSILATHQIPILHIDSRPTTSNMWYISLMSGITLTLSSLKDFKRTNACKTLPMH
jgi:chorismate mutase / prephenate dehydratase